MGTSPETIPKAVDMWFSGEMLCVRLEDGREVGTPLDWFPKLKSASEIQRSHWRFIGQGIGIHWEDIDEDISVENLIVG
jgi:hypothetical protein